ncbi:hypothetical protein M876_12555 [Elizabethkingia anophelis FMS-007]|nr:hypothetical protein M876_12555 [Elizabethkingia anophelis FMS-007]
MKLIYNVPNREMAARELNNFAGKWNHKYPYEIQSWQNNWEELTVFFFLTFLLKSEKSFIPQI